MADWIDIAQASEENVLEAQIENARGKIVGASAHFCEDCDVPIPEARRTAIAGVQCCIHCQQIRELTRKHFRA